MRAQIGDIRPPVEQASIQQDLDVIHSQLPDLDIEVSSECGKSLDIEQAISLAQDDDLE
jgi:hypothetical protein